ncbi:translation initiation factor 3, partial [Paracoccus rhizosphaerae]
AAAEAALQAADRAAAAAANDAAPIAAAEEAATAAQDAAEAATATADAAGVAAQIEALLTPEGFDRAAVERIIDDAAIPDPQKATLKRLVATAEGNPELLSAALEQVKAVMR